MRLKAGLWRNAVTARQQLPKCLRVLVCDRFDVVASDDLGTVADQFGQLVPVLVDLEPISRVGVTQAVIDQR